MLSIALEVLVLVSLNLHFIVDCVNLLSDICFDRGGYSVLVFFELMTDVMQLHPGLVQLSVIA